MKSPGVFRNSGQLHEPEALKQVLGASVGGEIMGAGPKGFPNSYFIYKWQTEAQGGETRCPALHSETATVPIGLTCTAPLKLGVRLLPEEQSVLSTARFVFLS